MAPEDRIAFVVVILTICGIAFLTMWGVREMGEWLFGWFASGAEGVGYRSAFFISLFVAFSMILIFAVVSGGGDLIGELPFVLAGFFILLMFFTFTIAWMF